MAHVKKGHLVPALEWAKHLRPVGRRFFWSRHRQAEQSVAREDVRQMAADIADDTDDEIWFEIYERELRSTADERDYAWWMLSCYEPGPTWLLGETVRYANIA